MTRTTRLAWLDGIRGVALAWIFLNHLVERVFGAPLIANPTGDWPPLPVRLDQLAPLQGHGGLDVPLNALRYVGWAGDQGVQLFLVASGFGLTWSLLRQGAGARLRLRAFYVRRLRRIYPLWVAAHVALVAAWLLTGRGAAPTDPRLYASLLGFRVTPDLLYWIVPAWWFFALLIQLYLVYPWLWRALSRLGPGRLLAVACAVGFGLRASGLLALDGAWIDAWSRGSIFVTRLPEFVLGICLAAWMWRDPVRVGARLRGPLALAAAAGGYLVATGLSLTLVGMAVAPFALGACAFVAAYAALSLRRERPRSALDWTGRHSYSLFLVHQPAILLLVARQPTGRALPVVAAALAAVGLTVVSALALERATDTTTSLVVRWHRRLGGRRLGVRLGGAAVLIVAGLVASELSVRALAPQEVLGWGERPSLRPDPRLGWTLRPSRTTRLRWRGYDYRVTASSLGFPAPAYPVRRQPGTLRVLAVGDAFTSAEGVDTDQAWPRLLEGALAGRLRRRRVQVMNFAITGYGPGQYARVLEHEVARLRPDVVVVASFVNDYEDAARPQAELQRQIGFGRPSPAGPASLPWLPHLRELLRLRVAVPLAAWLRRRPNPDGYALTNLATFERANPALGAGKAGMRAAFSRIASASRPAGAHVAVAMVPASVQVCPREQISHFPQHVDVADARTYDLELPQRMTTALARANGFRVWDLRPPLRGQAACPYQPRNRHWTAAGHRAVAAHLAGRVAQLARRANR